MSDLFNLKLKFWGVRGSIPTPEFHNLGFGGNTSCIEIRLPTGEILVFDGGTGIRALGLSLAREFDGGSLSLKLFLTHFHWDHIQGLPFFRPLWNAASEVTIHATPPQPAANLDQLLGGQMSSPYFPVDFHRLPAKISMCKLDNDPVTCGSAKVRPFPLNHPQGATGFRIESNGTSIVFATDVEHGNRELDRNLRKFAEKADILIYDAQYTPEEYEKFKGFGHSTWLEASKVARDAGVERLVLFHHDPSHDDRMFAGILRNVRQEFLKTYVAAEGQTLEV